MVEQSLRKGKVIGSSPVTGSVFNGVNRGRGFESHLRLSLHMKTAPIFGTVFSYMKALPSIYPTPHLKL
jgi:hypothetical protein